MLIITKNLRSASELCSAPTKSGRPCRNKAASCRHEAHKAHREALEAAEMCSAVVNLERDHGTEGMQANWPKSARIKCTSGKAVTVIIAEMNEDSRKARDAKWNAFEKDLAVVRELYAANTDEMIKARCLKAQKRIKARERLTAQAERDAQATARAIGTASMGEALYAAGLYDEMEQ